MRRRKRRKSRLEILTIISVSSTTRRYNLFDITIESYNCRVMGIHMICIVPFQEETAVENGEENEVDKEEEKMEVDEDEQENKKVRKI